jgi:hypothetical protein
MPRTGRPAAGFAWSIFSTAWWRELSDKLTDFLGSQAAGRRPDPHDPRGLPDLLGSDEPQDTFVLETPALGDAYNFRIDVRCSWCVQATAYRESRRRRAQEIHRLIDKHRPVIRERIEDTIRPLARKFPPYRAAEAESSIRTELGDCLAEGSIQVKIRVRVDVCEPVREDLQKIWRERLVEDAQGDLKKASVQLIAELQESWRDVLLSGLNGIGAVQIAKAGWIAPYALALAQDPEESAARYLRNMLEHRVSHAENLLAQLGDVVGDPTQLDALEFAFGTDSALRAVLSYLGVPVPDRDPGNGDGNRAGASHA